MCTGDLCFAPCRRDGMDAWRVWGDDPISFSLTNLSVLSLSTKTLHHPPPSTVVKATKDEESLKNGFKFEQGTERRETHGKRETDKTSALE
jgi:hypothetical protein